MPWKMSCAAMLTFITGSVPALQSAMTHRITTASVSIEVSLKRRIPFQSASWPKNPNSCKSGKIQKNNPVLCLLLILSLYSIQNYYPLQTRALQGIESSCPLLKKDFGKNVPHVYFRKSKSKINIFRVYFSWLLHGSPSIFEIQLIENQKFDWI